MSIKRLKMKDYPFEIEVPDPSVHQDVYDIFEGTSKECNILNFSFKI